MLTAEETVLVSLLQKVGITAGGLAGWRTTRSDKSQFSLIAEVEPLYKDGSQETIVTDENLAGGRKLLAVLRSL